jgi:hypothetical protein
VALALARSSLVAIPAARRRWDADPGGAFSNADEAFKAGRDAEADPALRS